MVFFIEFNGPFATWPRTNHVGALRRWIWLWLSIGYIDGTFDDLIEASLELNSTK